MTSITSQTIGKLISNIRSRKLTCVKVAQAFLDTIERNKELLSEIVYFNRESVLEQAAHMDVEADKAQYRGPLHGVPLLLGESVHVKHMQPSACADAAEKETEAPETVRLREAGAIFIAKARNESFAFGAALAARMAPAGLATDTRYTHFTHYIYTKTYSI